MAARVIPFEDSDTAQNISITDTDASPEGYILTATQNSVTFTNNASSPVSIAFNPTGILTNIPSKTSTPLPPRVADSPPNQFQVANKD